MSYQDKDLEMKVDNLPMALIKDNPYQARKSYQKKGIATLAKNISKRGLLHPVSVVKIKDSYVLVAGHRRFRAFKKLRRKEIPAIIRKESTESDLRLDMAIENCMRKSFTPVEKAEAILEALKTIDNVKNVIDAFSLIGAIKNYKKRDSVGLSKGNAKKFESNDLFKAQKILELIDVSENSATQHLRLLTLPENIKDKILVYNVNEKTSKKYISQGILSVSYGYEISRIKNEKLQMELYEKIIEENLRFIQVRAIVDQILEDNEEIAFASLGRKRGGYVHNEKLDSISKRVFNLSSTLWNQRSKITYLKMTLDETILKACLKRLRKACLEMINTIDAVGEVLSDEERILLANTEITRFKLNMRRRNDTDEIDYRYTFPAKVAKQLELRPGDVLEFDAKNIVRCEK